ncbi:MAG: bifunctional 5,10-methylenetetrahydrofolate dehydrogenase/5,10-methenyltetrahydrofolate cyclohydrolase [Candidatus Moranbacteria bacterium]|jgi:methylenetetrahydrofolate dehydrogenase (NADP+)/methenyltetrahydrofolate cyclohydrolase|nr:bifunctional 5,10-methylenetetrahydrofolate dehydrogenase/5,10-methenyltetrahydrofolate cyclohydrolase [Candidatus Moranbacteria bacterium]
MQLIKGREIADNILDNIRLRIEKMETKPTLAVILVGEDKASEIYVGLKEKAAQKIGIGFKLYKYNADVTEEVILGKIKEINETEDINGLIVQLPLPEKLDKHKIINAIDPQKDVDGFCEVNQELFFQNQDVLYPVFPKAIIKMVESVLADLKVKEETSFLALIKAVVICKSDDFGKIMRKYFEKIDIEAQYVFCDDLDNKKNLIRQADIIVTACGKRDLINFEMVKDGAIIIDGGIVKEGGKVSGDVDFETFKKTECLLSPVPGGVGPVTVACLLENTFQAYQESGNLGS